MKKRVVDYKQMNELLEIIASDQTKEVKATLMDNICNYDNIINSINYYKCYNAEVPKKLEKIYEVYQKFLEEGLLFHYSTTYNCDLNELKERLKHLEEIYNTFISTDSDYNKAMIFLKYYNNINTFKKSYNNIIRRGYNDSKLSKYKKLIGNYPFILSTLENLEEKGILKDVAYVLKYDVYNTYYDYAKFVINYYLNFPNSSKRIFLDTIGIDEETFVFCQNVVKELNVDLYNEFINKKHFNQKRLFYIYKRKLNYIANGLETGITEDGKVFDTLEFIKQLPFKFDANFLAKLKNFMSTYTPNIYNPIIKYVYENNLNYLTDTKLLDIDKLLNTKEIVKGKVISKEDKKIIIEYLRRREIPLMLKTYVIARDQYLNGELVMPEEEPRKIVNQALTLIPSQVKK